MKGFYTIILICAVVFGFIKGMNKKYGGRALIWGSAPSRVTVTGHAQIDRI